MDKESIKNSVLITPATEAIGVKWPVDINWPVSVDGSTNGSITKKMDEWQGATGYQCLAKVLQQAHDQAAYGKGRERHANGKPFLNQPMQDIIRLHGVGFATGQASKKAGEALGLPTKERQVAELLGAVVYLCGAIIAIEHGEGQ